MSKPKNQMTGRARKKMNKEVRASTIQPAAQPTSDIIKAESLLSRFPKKVRKKVKASLKSLGKNMAVKQKKKNGPHARRASPGTPGTEGREATPRSAHIEGKRWMKTTESKIQASKKVQRRRSLKQK